MLEHLFNPGSIAVVGASRDTKKVGYSVLSNLKEANFSGDVYPINPTSPEILGYKAYPKVSQVGKQVDMAVIVVPSKFVLETLLDCSKAGVRAAVVITAGFKETGAEGRKLEEEMKRIGRDNDIRILGPNCLGLINTSNSMNASFAPGMPPRGRTAIISQSGALGVAILDWAISNDFGFSQFVSLGNKSDISETDCIEFLMSDPETDVILGYIEDIVDGRRFLEVARKVTQVKPIVILKSGSTKAGERAASSHTGALAGSDIAFASAFKQTGIIRAEGLQDLFDSAVAFSGKKLPKGNNLLIVTNAGGPGIIAADTSEKLGLNLPLLTLESIEAIRDHLPATASLFNPLDVIGDADAQRYNVVLEKAIHDPDIDGILVLLTPQAVTETEKTAEIIITASKMSDKPMLASFMGGARVIEASRMLKEKAIPNFAYCETAVKAFKWLSDYSLLKSMSEEPKRHGTYDMAHVQEIIDNAIKSHKYEVGEKEAMPILSSYGFIFPQKALARTPRQASTLAAQIGFPVVMKVVSSDVLHKTDVGGVKVNIATPEEAEEAFIEISTNIYRLVPDAFIEGIMIYEMVRGGKEVILGITYDKTFGHMIMFGLGGIYVEVLKDVSFRIAPVTYRQAAEMIHEVKTSAMLMGARGEKPLDVDSIIESILRLSDLVTDFPTIQEMDVNPLRVMERGAIALDCRMIFRR